MLRHSRLGALAPGPVLQLALVLLAFAGPGCATSQALLTAAPEVEPLDP